MNSNELLIFIKSIPNKPGIYKYFNADNEILYIGKAKDLKKRVQSYFLNKSDLNRKTKNLINQIFKIEYTVVDSELDALLLENNLIKENQPKYNILLKDGKSYPYICILNEAFPRVISVRNKNNNGKYYGPYPSGITQHSILEFIHQLFPLRTCTLNLSNQNIKQNKFKPCLEFHIGKCNAPCTGKETEKTYNNYILQIDKILNGKIFPVKNYFKEKMLQSAENMEYELANNFKAKLTSLENYQSKSSITNDDELNTDVISLKKIDKKVAINYLLIKEGNIIATKTFEAKSKLDESEENIIEFAYYQMRTEFKSNNPFVISSHEFSIENIEIQIPKIGSKKKLVELSLKNCYSLLKQTSSEKTVNRKNSGLRILEQAKIDLKLKEIPTHIECFDNSNIQGTTPVSAMVCFKNSLPSKKDYRHYNVQNIEGPNDFESMYQVVKRRYNKLINDKNSLPQLIVIDGGKGQLSSAYKALSELDLTNKIAIISIAKRLEELYYPNDPYPIHLKKNSTTLKLIQRLRDEAHRFGITFHRQKRDKNSIQEKLKTIDGIGEKTYKKIILKYKSFDNFKNELINNYNKIENEFGISIALKIKKGLQL